MRRSGVVLILIAVLVAGFALWLRSQDAPVAAGPSDSTSSTAAGDHDSSTSTQPDTSTSTAPLPQHPVCDLHGEVAVMGTVESPDLVEASGLAVSRTTPDVLWSHNDSRDGPYLYAMTTGGADLGAFEIPGTFALDWEDIAIGPAADGTGSYIYVADIGDNLGIRSGVVNLWRVADADPAALEPVFRDPVPISLEMPGGPYDAEAIFIDPVDPSVYLITKSRDEALVFRGPLEPAEEPHEMTLVTTLFLDAEVSGADISPDGQVIALRGYRTVWMWTRSAGETIEDAFGLDPCTAPSPDETQGESIALTADWSYFTVSEGANSPISYVPAG